MKQTWRDTSSFWQVRFEHLFAKERFVSVSQLRHQFLTWFFRKRCLTFDIIIIIQIYSDKQSLERESKSCSSYREVAHNLIIIRKSFTVKLQDDQRNQEGTFSRITFPACLHEPHLSHNVAMSVAGGQVQRRVISTVHDVNASPSHDEHVYHAGAALPACPVERAEAMVISTVREEHSYSAQVSQQTFSTARTYNNCRGTCRKSVWIEGEKKYSSNFSPLAIHIKFFPANNSVVYLAQGQVVQIGTCDVLLWQSKYHISKKDNKCAFQRKTGWSIYDFVILPVTVIALLKYTVLHYFSTPFISIRVDYILETILSITQHNSTALQTTATKIIIKLNQHL